MCSEKCVDIKLSKASILDESIKRLENIVDELTAFVGEIEGVGTLDEKEEFEKMPSIAGLLQSAPKRIEATTDKIQKNIVRIRSMLF